MKDTLVLENIPRYLAFWLLCTPTWVTIDWQFYIHACLHHPALFPNGGNLASLQEVKVRRKWRRVELSSSFKNPGDRALGKVTLVTDTNGSQIMSSLQTSTLSRIFMSWFQCCNLGAGTPCDMPMS